MTVKAEIKLAEHHIRGEAYAELGSVMQVKGGVNDGFTIVDSDLNLTLQNIKESINGINEVDLRSGNSKQHSGEQDEEIDEATVGIPSASHSGDMETETNAPCDTNSDTSEAQDEVTTSSTVDSEPQDGSLTFVPIKFK